MIEEVALHAEGKRDNVELIEKLLFPKLLFIPNIIELHNLFLKRTFIEILGA